MQQHFLDKLSHVKRIASYSKLKRFANDPLKYIYAIAYRQLFYPWHKQEKQVRTETFFGKKMSIYLPASTDIYLTGGKSHDSEIRLAHYLIENLSPGDHFLDIGAHVGYFSLLSAELVGTAGKVKSFEPTQKTYDLLDRNTQACSQIEVFNLAVNDTDTPITFYQFPPMYSEYNSTDVSQYEHEKWFASSPPTQVVVPTTTIDLITANEDFTPNIIKIDVEGAEHFVLKGGFQFITQFSPTIIMEYLEPKRKNTSHREAAQYLNLLHYDAYAILPSGKLSSISDIDAYLAHADLASDNIVFKKS